MPLRQLALDLGNVIPLEQQAGGHRVGVDTPDTGPVEEELAAPKEKPPGALRPA